MNDIIGITILQLLRISWPYVIIGAITGFVVIISYWAGKARERSIWRHELSNGNRLGERAKEQIDRRDRRIQNLVTENVRIKNWISRLILQRKRAMRLSLEVVEIMAANSVSEDIVNRKREKLQ